MTDFARFDEIFGIDRSKKKSKSPATPLIKSRKRRSLPQEKEKVVSPFALPIRRIRYESPSQQKKPPNYESPDKRDILPHLSCDADDFEMDLQLIVDSDDSGEEIKM